MKALVLEKNAVLKYKDVPEPEIMPDECLVAVRNSGICNSDIFRAYNNGAYFYPLVMGHEFSGVIEKTGRSARNYKKGDRVSVFPLISCKSCEFCKAKKYAQCVKYDYYGSRRNGAFAQYIAVKEWNIFPLPKDVTFQEAALLEPVSVAAHALRKIKFKNKHSVLILGAGLIGQIIAKYLSEHIDKNNVYLVDRNNFKLAIAKKYGVNTINSLPDKKWLEKLIKYTCGGVDCAIEACGAIDTYRQSLKAAKSYGDVLWVGNITGDLGLEKKLVSSVLRREIKIHGCWNSSFYHSKNDDWNFALRFIKSLDLKQMISHRVRLEKGEYVFLKLFQSKVNRDDKGRRKEQFLKVIFDVS